MKTILIAILAVLSVSLAGVLYYHNFIKPTFATSPEFSKQCCGMPKGFSGKDQPVVQNKNEIAEWQTYKNEQYGFEFKYPSKYVALNYGYEEHVPAKKAVAIFSHDTKYSLGVIVFNGLIKDYRFEDPSAGGSFMFDSQSQKWKWTRSNNETNEIVAEVEKIDTGANIEAYLYKTGDILNSKKVIIIPNPNLSLVVEIIATTRATETANDYVATPLDFDIKEMFFTFKFIK